MKCQLQSQQLCGAVLHCVRNDIYGWADTYPSSAGGIKIMYQITYERYKILKSDEVYFVIL